MGPIAIAKICHEVNKAWCEYLGDTSQLPWESAPEWQRDSAINGVNFHIAHPEATDAASHESWLAEKTAAGWKYGPVKDVDKKEHPCYVPFSELPKDQQFKDSLFRTIVHAATPSALKPFAGVVTDAATDAAFNEFFHKDDY